jgi:hypothetical protein
MILERGNMWDVFGKTDLFLITTNPIVRKDGAVVMGRGIAKEAANRFPELPFDFGRKIKPPRKRTQTGIIGCYGGQMVGWFMVKSHWQEPARLDIIKASVASLVDAMHFTNIVGERRIPSDFRVDLNFPGIGNGKLKREDVLPLLVDLPDNVHIWEYDI